MHIFYHNQRSKMGKMNSFIQISVLHLMFCNLIYGNTVDIQKELTIIVKPGETSCFFEKVKANQLIDLEYQVIDSSHGDLDISFEMKNPNSYAMQTDYKKSDNIHRLIAHIDGDYGFCFDNSFSVYSSKTVFFEVIIEWDENAHVERTDDFADFRDKMSPESQFDLKQQKIQTMYKDAVGTTENMHDRLNEIKHHLDIRRSFEARDRNLAEASNFHVGAWSSFQIVLMCIVGSIQVYMLRSLFETDPRANIWNKIKFLK